MYEGYIINIYTRGMVTLVGKAENTAERDLATQLANHVNGVKSVKNLMTIE
jgi:osmotically-inducible protein OsmY